MKAKSRRVLTTFLTRKYIPYPISFPQKMVFTEKGGLKMNIKRRATTVLAVMLVVLWAVGGQAFAQQTASPAIGPKMASPGMLTPGEARGPRRMIPHPLMEQINMWERFLLFQKDRFGLNLDQVDRIGSLLNGQRKLIIQKNAQTRILLIDIQELLLKDPADLKKTEEKVRELATLYGDMMMEQVRMFNKVLDVLTAQQRKEALDCFRESTYTKEIIMD
jgi:Spy/CpxP family protein refolding chaperone